MEFRRAPCYKDGRDNNKREGAGMKIGEVLREKRRAAGLTQEQAANAPGITAARKEAAESLHI